MAQSKTIILTGASRGIGLAIAHFLLGQKHNLVVVARSQGPLDDLKKQYDGQVHVLAGDLADFNLGEKAKDAALQAWGHLDGLILNHGVLDPVERVANATIDEWRKAFDVNYFSCVAMIRACLPSLRQSNGKIIMTSSGAAVKGYAGWGFYGASKAAMNQLALTLATEEPKVTTMAIRPGTVDTVMQQALREQHGAVMDKDKVDHFTNLKTSGKLLKPEQPGNVIARLALDAPNELSGTFADWNDDKLNKFQDS